jgi:hypothetical protein
MRKFYTRLSRYDSRMAFRRLCALAACAWAVFAQDAYRTCPQNYTLEFENQYVRISRVRHLPGDSLPVHSHPSLPTVYVYLTDGGPIRFSHVSPKFTIERPAVRAGGIRFNRNAQVETHTVEYLGDAPAEYLRVELKTTPGDKHRDFRIAADDMEPREDQMIRISRPVAVAALRTPAVAVTVADRSYRFLGAGEAAPAGKDVVLIELKTPATS